MSNLKDRDDDDVKLLVNQSSESIFCKWWMQYENINKRVGAAKRKLGSWFIVQYCKNPTFQYFD